MTRLAGMAIGCVGDEILRGSTAVIVSEDDIKGRTFAAVDHQGGVSGPVREQGQQRSVATDQGQQYAKNYRLRPRAGGGKTGKLTP
jgi:hypothetical protein